jgi:phage terminase Nu1 subunit (DNA packaging protein)
MKAAKGVSKAEIARILDKDVRSITNYIQEGMPIVRTGRSPTFDVVACVRWFVDREREAARSGKELNELDQMRARKAFADARKTELELAELEGALLPLDVHEARVRQLCERLAGRVKTLNRYRGDVQRAVTAIEVDELLERIEDEMLAALMASADEIEDEPPTPDEEAA